MSIIHQLKNSSKMKKKSKWRLSSLLIYSFLKEIEVYRSLLLKTKQNKNSHWMLCFHLATSLPPVPLESSSWRGKNRISSCSFLQLTLNCSSQRLCIYDRTAKFNSLFLVLTVLENSAAFNIVGQFLLLKLSFLRMPFTWNLILISNPVFISGFFSFGHPLNVGIV